MTCSTDFGYAEATIRELALAFGAAQGDPEPDAPLVYFDPNARPLACGAEGEVYFDPNEPDDPYPHGKLWGCGHQPGECIDWLATSDEDEQCSYCPACLPDAIKHGDVIRHDGSAMETLAYLTMKDLPLTQSSEVWAWAQAKALVLATAPPLAPVRATGDSAA